MQNYGVGTTFKLNLGPSQFYLQLVLQRQGIFRCNFGRVWAPVYYTIFSSLVGMATRLIMVGRCDGERASDGKRTGQNAKD